MTQKCETVSPFAHCKGDAQMVIHMHEVHNWASGKKTRIYVCDDEQKHTMNGVVLFLFSPISSIEVVR